MDRLRAPLIMTLVAGIALLVVPVLAAQGGSSNKARGRTVMVRTPDAVDADAKGRIDFRVKKGDYTLRIKAQKLTGVTAVDVLLLDDEGDVVEVIRANVAVDVEDGDGTAKVTLRSRDGDTFEGDGTPIDGELTDKPVGVRRAGEEDVDLLWGFIPDLEDNSGPRRIKTKKQTFASIDGSRVRLRWRARDGRIRIEMKVPLAELVEGDSVGFLLYPEGFDDDDDAFVLGFATVDDEGKVKLKLRTDHGDPLPPDILEDVSRLSGAAVRVFYDADGDGEYDDDDDDGGPETKIDGNLPTF